MNWTPHLDKFGVAGSFIAAACCLGLPAIVSILAALGLGFLISDAVLLPLLLLFLIVTVGGLYLGYRRHRRPGALILGVASSLMTMIFIFVFYVAALAYLSIGGLVAASVLNVVSRRRCGAVCET